MSTRKSDIAQLDKHYPPCGPCGFCGHRDKRHRLWDSLLGAPEDDETTAKIYGVTVDHVRDVRRIRPYRKSSK